MVIRILKAHRNHLGDKLDSPEENQKRNDAQDTLDKIKEIDKKFWATYPDWDTVEKRSMALRRIEVNLPFTYTIVCLLAKYDANKLKQSFPDISVEDVNQVYNALKTL